MDKIRFCIMWIFLAGDFSGLWLAGLLLALLGIMVLTAFGVGSGIALLQKSCGIGQGATK